MIIYVVYLIHFALIIMFKAYIFIQLGKNFDGPQLCLEG